MTHTLFDLPPTNGTVTSTLAAHSIRPCAATLRQRVLDCIEASADGHTCDEVEVLLDMRHQTCSARFNELKRGGMIQPTGLRLTRSGRNAEVYQVCK